MAPLEKLRFLFSELDHVILPGGLSLGSALWLYRTLVTSNALLGPSQFGDGSPLSFNRSEEPLEYWSLVILFAIACALGVTVTILRTVD
jgi:hypothetical protein